MRIVISGVSLVSGGPLTVFRDSLAAAREELDDDVEIHAIVNRRSLFDTHGVIYHEFPDANRTWLHRLRFEYRTARKLSRQIKPDFWLSMHDASPKLNGEIQAVYCHNTAPFFSPTFWDIWLAPKLGIFVLLYRYVYRYNIKANSLIIVQQDWLRQAFATRFLTSNILVARPDVADLSPAAAAPAREPGRKTTLFYPTLARSFKNIETVARACELLEEGGRTDVELRVTISPDENRYARWLARRFERTASVRFIGRQDRHSMAKEYQKCAAVVFPSRLESWGLPLTEAKTFSKMILAADLAYARETIGTYDRAMFLPVLGVEAWKDAIDGLATGQLVTKGQVGRPIAEPFVEGWRDTWRYLATLFLPAANRE